MARPLKEGLDYFPHDTDAANDEKLEALRAIYGNDGYAFYFILLERIYRTPDFELDISDAETIQIFARKVAVTPERFKQMLATALKWGCFDQQAYEERHVLTSNGIKKRASVVVKKREEMRSKYQKDKLRISEAETHQETQPETPQSKVKESKENKKDLYAEELSLEKQLHSENSENQEKRFSAAELIKFFEKDFSRPLGSTESEQVISWLKVHQPEVIKEALRRAVLNGKYNFRYIDKILLSWERANKRTLREVLEYEQAMEQQRNRSGPAEEASKVIQISEKRREETIRSACDYIRLQCGPDPPREKAEEIALRYGEEFVPVIIRHLFGGISP